MLLGDQRRQSEVDFLVAIDEDGVQFAAPSGELVPDPVRVHDGNLRSLLKWLRGRPARVKPSRSSYMTRFGLEFSGQFERAKVRLFDNR